MAGGVHFGIRVRTGLLAAAAVGVDGSELDLTGTKLVLTGSGTGLDCTAALLAGKVFDVGSSALEFVLVFDDAASFGCTVVGLTG